MQAKNFDELTKALAATQSRRHALKVIATASLGGLFGLAGIRSVFGSNKNCAKWCAQVFGPNTSAAGQCTSQAAHGTGLCSTCGNVAPSSICCVRNTSGYCNGTSVAACCASGQHCCSGTCSECCANSDCTNGNTCGSNNTCVCGSGAGCTGSICGSGAGCTGSNTCLNGSCCPTANVCGSVCGCPAGQHCSDANCVPNCTATGGTCTVNTDCCSNNCQSGHCGCASGCTLLANGTCARPCGMFASCNTCGAMCGGSFSNPGGLCGSQFGNGHSCTSDVDCPTGSYCNVGLFCVDACC